MRRWPLRVRLTLAFSLVMAVVLAVTGLVVYRIFRGDLNGTIDRSLQTRSDEVAGVVRRAGPSITLSGEGDDFVQVLGPRGEELAATPKVRGLKLAAPTHAAGWAQHAGVPGIDGELRMRLTPVGRDTVVVGTSLGQRDDSLRTLAALLGVGGFVALVLASLAGYGVASGALRPVEAMRRRAAAISSSRLDERLPVPDSADEIARLGETLNEMLDRLEAAFARERTFAADASHELRTPLAILTTEIELALREGRSPEELRAALESAGEETERLVRLAEDLLVLARVDDGRLPLRVSDVDCRELLESVADRFESAERPIHVDAAAGLSVRADPERLGQALGNMLDNALRHGEGAIRLTAMERGESVELHVIDEGAGLPPEFAPHAFERFARADGARSRGGAGLGLAIVAAIAASHGGHAKADGADVWIETVRAPLQR